MIQSLDQQIEFLRDLAQRQYPENEAARNAYLVEKLTEKLRGYHAMLQPLPVREMTDGQPSR